MKTKANAPQSRDGDHAAHLQEIQTSPCVSDSTMTLPVEPIIDAGAVIPVCASNLFSLPVSVDNPEKAISKEFDPGVWQTQADALALSLPDDRMRRAFKDAVTKSFKSAIGGEAQPVSSAIHWAREARQPLPPIDWLINSLVVAGSLVLLAGDGGTGKTYAVLDLAVRLAMGADDWLGFVLKQCTVLIVDEESGHLRLMHRLRQVMDGNDTPDDIPLATLNMQNIQLIEPLGQAKLEAAIEETQAKFVVIDALVDVTAGVNSDKADEIQPVFHFLRTLAEKHGCTFLLIDHTNRSGTYRGSSGKKGAVDLMLIVERETKSDLLTFKTEKARDIEQTTFSARMNFTPEKFNLSPAGAAPTMPHFNKGETFVLRHLSAHNGQATLLDIAAQADTVSGKTAQNATRNLVGRGYTKRVDVGGKGDLAVYALTDKGRALNG